MRKTIMALILAILATAAMADEQRKVTLDSDHKQQTVQMSFCNIFVTLLNPEAEDAPQVMIEVENLDEARILAVFKENYSEKKVKKLRPSFQYDKLFGGTKGQRTIEAYSMPLHENVFIEPSLKKSLDGFTISDTEGTTTARLPLYIAKPKNGIVQRIMGKEKLLLLSKQVVELQIEVSTKPSAEYTALQKDIDGLRRDLRNTVFCTHKSHRPGVAKQQEPFQKRIDDLRKRIDNTIAAHGWSEADAGYQRYDALRKDINDLSNLDKRNGLCSKHSPSPKDTHQCAYCNLSLQQIYHKLDDIYKKIYTASDRKAMKAQLMGQASALYGCCTAADCSKHAAQWRSGGDYKSKITERYNRIKGL